MFFQLSLSRRLVPKNTKTIWRSQVRKFHFASICNVLPCELRLFWYSTRVLNRHLANRLPTFGPQSADCWQKIFVEGGKRQSADSWLTVVQLWADCRPTAGQQSADSYLGELFFIFSDEASVSHMLIRY